MFTACVLKTPFPVRIPTSCWRHVFTFATVHATDADVTFYDGPGMHTIKATKQVYNSTWIALLKHGFVLVKTWLLIACGTGFYAIMHVIQRFDGWRIRIAKHSDSKTWLQFGRTEGSITQRKNRLCFNGHLRALMGYLWLTKYQIFFQADIGMVRIGYRPKRDLHSVFFPFDYYMSLKYLQTIRRRWFSISESSLRNYKLRYYIRWECKCGFLVLCCFR